MLLKEHFRVWILAPLDTPVLTTHLRKRSGYTHTSAVGTEPQISPTFPPNLTSEKNQSQSHGWEEEEEEEEDHEDDNWGDELRSSHRKSGSQDAAGVGAGSPCPQASTAPCTLSERRPPRSAAVRWPLSACGSGGRLPLFWVHLEAMWGVLSENPCLKVEDPGKAFTY